MPRDEDDDWIDTLIKLGIGVLAIYFLAKLLDEGGGGREGEVICPNCGTRIRKWARECPRCRTSLIWR